MSVRDDGTPSSPQFADLARGASEQTPQDSQEGTLTLIPHPRFVSDRTKKVLGLEINKEPGLGLSFFSCQVYGR